MFNYSKVKWLHTYSNTNTSLRLIRAIIIIRETSSVESCLRSCYHMYDN